MRPHSSSAYLTSITLHAFVAAVIVMTTLYVARTKEMPKIIELVQGPGDDLNALEAPAEGVPNPVKMEVPIPKVEAPPTPQPQVEQTPAAPEPPITKTVSTKPEPATPPVKAKSDTPIAKPKPDTSLSKQVKQSAKTSYKDYLKKHPIPKQSIASQVRNNANVPRVDTVGIVGGAKGGSQNSKAGSGGKALTREEADQLSTYISFLLQELKKAYEAPPGVSDQLIVRVSFDITASGSILNPKIVKGSGNRDFDDAVLDAFRRVRSIGPTPNRRADTWIINFQMKDEG